MTDYFAQTAVLMAGLWPKLVAGFLITLELTAAATPLALLFGLLLLAPRMDRRAYIRAPAIGFIELMRNTPLLVQIYLVYSDCRCSASTLPSSCAASLAYLCSMGLFWPRPIEGLLSQSTVANGMRLTRSA